MQSFCLCSYLFPLYHSWVHYHWRGNSHMTKRELDFSDDLHYMHRRFCHKPLYYRCCSSYFHVLKPAFISFLQYSYPVIFRKMYFNCLTLYKAGTLYASSVTMFWKLSYRFYSLILSPTSIFDVLLAISIFIRVVVRQSYHTSKRSTVSERHRIFQVSPVQIHIRVISQYMKTSLLSLSKKYSLITHKNRRIRNQHLIHLQSLSQILILPSPIVNNLVPSRTRQNKYLPFSR